MGLAPDEAAAVAAVQAPDAAMTDSEIRRTFNTIDLDHSGSLEPDEILQGWVLFTPVQFFHNTTMQNADSLVDDGGNQDPHHGHDAGVLRRDVHRGGDFHLI